MIPKKIIQGLTILMVSLLFVLSSSAQCTVNGSGAIGLTSIICAETGNPPVSGDDIIIPNGVTLTSTSNNQNLGIHNVIIESGGIFLNDHNNMSMDGNVIVESGGLFQINNKLYMECGSAISVQSGGTVITGSSSGASDRLSICGNPIIQGGGGNCDDADGSQDSNPPYCAGDGISGPTGFDETGEVPGVLPIILLSFNATDQANGVILDWSTAVEERNDYFRLENSRDGKSYELVTQIEGAGNSSALKRYEYLHESPYTGISYYRLVQVDTDEKQTVYGPIRIDRSIVGEFAVFPNPMQAGQKLNIRRSAEDEGDVKISLMDLQGRLIKGWEMFDAKSMQLDMPSNLNKGIYLLEISGGESKKLRRLVLQ